MVDISGDKGRFGVNRAGGKLQQMKDDENKNNGPAPIHGARSIGGVDGLFAGVADGSGGLAAERQLDGGGNMQGDGEQKDAALNSE